METELFTAEQEDILDRIISATGDKETALDCWLALVKVKPQEVFDDFTAARMFVFWKFLSGNKTLLFELHSFVADYMVSLLSDADKKEFSTKVLNSPAYAAYMQKHKKQM